MKVLHVALLAAALAVPAPAALAQGKGNKGKPAKADKADKDKDKDKGHDTAAAATAGGRRVVFVDADREAARTWWRSSYGRNCPPGLAKKNNGCLPPGQAKKRYSVGSPVPTDVVLVKVPAGIRLSAAPAGYRYVYVDGDVLLIDSATRVVADVIENLLD